MYVNILFNVTHINPQLNSDTSKIQSHFNQSKASSPFSEVVDESPRFPQITTRLNAIEPVSDSVAFICCTHSHQKSLRSHYHLLRQGITRIKLKWGIKRQPCWRKHIDMVFAMQSALWASNVTMRKTRCHYGAMVLSNRREFRIALMIWYFLVVVSNTDDRFHR